jgi:hypothetical protein
LITHRGGQFGRAQRVEALSGGPHQIALEDLVLDEFPAINVLVLLNVRMVGKPDISNNIGPSNLFRADSSAPTPIMHSKAN